jgi:two-component system LytT family sensor kinase
LSDLLRMTLTNIGVQEVTLQQELEFLHRYLDIQRMRFQDRLEVVVDIPPETLDLQVPNQVLQPIVENAVRHGIDARSGSGRIEVRARATEHMLVLTVRDDGPGLQPFGAPPPPRAGEPSVGRERRGIGLANTRARLRELYGPAGTLSLENHPNGGTLVTLTIPLRRAEPSAASVDRVAGEEPSSALASPSPTTALSILASPWVPSAAPLYPSAQGPRAGGPSLEMKPHDPHPHR